jgi:hypothetical protein
MTPGRFTGQSEEGVHRKARFGSLIRSVQLGPALFKEYTPDCLVVLGMVREGLPVDAWNIIVNDDRGFLSVDIEIHQVDSCIVNCPSYG